MKINAIQRKERNQMPSWEAYLKENQPRFIDELKQFLRFPSISSLPEHAVHVQGAAEWLAGRLKAAAITKAKMINRARKPNRIRPRDIAKKNLKGLIFEILD